MAPVDEEVLGVDLTRGTLLEMIDFISQLRYMGTDSEITSRVHERAQAIARKIPRDLWEEAHERRSTL